MKDTAENCLRRHMREIDLLTNISRTLSWDMRVNLPKSAAEYRGATMAYVADRIYALSTARELSDALGALEAASQEDEILRAMVRRARRQYDKLTSTPRSLYSEYAEHTLRSELVWQEARRECSYDMLLPYLEKEFELKRRLAECRGFALDPLTGLMDEWEAGTSRSRVDALFSDVKAFLIPFISRIRSAKVPAGAGCIAGSYPIEAQKLFCREVMERVGYKFDCGRIDESAHPYTTANFRCDIRMTTHYYENDFTRAVISCLHEGGHAMYWQNFSPKLDATMLNASAGDGMDESQARFFENIIGRSLPFWKWCAPVAKRAFPSLSGVCAEHIYAALNAVRPSAVRLDSDELSYSLHIIIRYELEKLIFDGKADFAKLPRLWADKYEEYLGVRPENDAEGILQDMHWASGYIGYFQNYVLGNFYDGHYLHTMTKAIPNMFDDVAKGDFSAVTAWQAENVQRFGALYAPAEILRRFSGEELCAKYYLDYLEEKYSRLYGV